MGDRALKEEQMKRLQGLAPKAVNVSRSHTVQSIPSAQLRDLGEAEWDMILDSHDEYMRRGAFERIFPRKDTSEQYSQFSPSPRYSNMVLGRWLEAGGEQCFSHESAASGQVPP